MNIQMCSIILFFSFFFSGHAGAIKPVCERSMESQAAHVDNGGERPMVSTAPAVRVKPVKLGKELFKKAEAAPVVEVPIVYRPEYDIDFFGIEKLHPFDTKKYGKIADSLSRAFDLPAGSYHAPEMVTDADLKRVHTERYLASLRGRWTVMRVTEVPPLWLLPNFLQQRKLLNPIRYATQGTVVAAELAMKHGWAVNLAGGYHHAKKDAGEGFCFFADIPLAIQKLRDTIPGLKVLIVDLDAHRGNGLESIKGQTNDTKTFIFDMYTRGIYPGPRRDSEVIDFDHGMDPRVNDTQYLNRLKTELPKAIAQTKPNLIIYNAGSDIFMEDPLGGMKVSSDGIKARDEFVFAQALQNEIPIAMVLSGGYSPKSAAIVSASLENIIRKFKLLRT